MKGGTAMIRRLFARIRRLICSGEAYIMIMPDDVLVIDRGI